MSHTKQITFWSIVSLLCAAAALSSVAAAPPAAPAKRAAPVADEAAPAKKVVTPSAATFSDVMQATIAVGLPNLTAAQSATVSNLFADGSDTSPRVMLLKNMVYQKALRDGAIEPGTEIGAVNWTGLLAFIQGLLPIIEAIITLFGG